jgi:internalin A
MSTPRNRRTIWCAALVLIAAAPLVWSGLKWRQLQIRRAAVSALQQRGCQVFYAHEMHEDRPRIPIVDPDRSPPGPEWLRTLNLMATGITDAGISSLKRLSAIENLALDFTQVTDEGLLELQDVGTLKAVSLDCTHVTAGAVDAVRAARGDLEVTWSAAPSEKHRAACVRLQRAGFYVQAEPGENDAARSRYQARLPSLGEAISRANVRHWIGDESHLGELKAVENLVDLSLESAEGVPVSDFGIRHLASIATLEVLNLRHGHITDAGLDHLQELSNLRELNLSSTRITDEAAARLRSLTSIEKLYLDDTQIGDATLAALGDLPNLRTLYVRGTQVTRQGHESFREKNVRCLVVSQ